MALKKKKKEKGRKINENTTNKNTLILSFSLFSKEAAEVFLRKTDKEFTRGGGF